MNKVKFILTVLLYQFAFSVNRLNGFEDTVVVGPRCIPLTSKNIRANPYHSSLLSMPGKQIRVGFGVPSHLPVNPMKCNRDSPHSCTIRFSESISTTISNSYSISLGKSQGFSSQIGKAQTDGNSNSLTKSIGKSIEKSISQQLTVSDEASLAETISESLSKTHEKSTGFAETKSKEVSNSNTISQETSSSDTVSTEVSVSESVSKETTKSSSSGGSQSKTNSRSRDTGGSVTAGFFGKVFGVSATVSHSRSQSSSETNERSWSTSESESSGTSQSSSSSSGASKTYSLSNGNSNTVSNSEGSSSTADNRASDSVSISKEKAGTSSKSNSISDTSGKSESNSYRVDDSYQSSAETSLTKNSALSNESSKSETTNNETAVAHTYSTSYDRTYMINPGDCKIAVCLTKVKALAIPYECISETNDTTIELFADYFFDMELNKNGTVKCYEGLIDCFDENKKSYFQIENNEYLNANIKNSLTVGEHLVMNHENSIGEKFGLRALNDQYTLELKSSGELVLYRGNILLWSNGMSHFDESKHKIRMRINEKGHFVEEVQGIFTDFSKEYRKDEWILVWSTAPIHHNVVIGIPKIPDSPSSYKLVLENNGKLNLYDAVGALIWCATEIGHRKCNHQFGYQFPENYLVPTNMLTPPRPDKHNSIDPRVTFTQSSIESIDVNCKAGLMQNQGIMSKNKRFKLILEESGNMIIKDGYRTMWDSASGYLHFAEAPFKLVVIPSGNVAILDSNNLLIWNSVVQSQNSTRPYKLELQDSGRLVVTDSKKQEIWESTPLRQLSFGMTIYTKIIYKYAKCHWKHPRRAQNITEMKSNLRNTIGVNEWLLSENQKHSLRISNSNRTLFLDKQPLFEVNAEDENLFQLRALKITDDGDLLLVNVNNDTVWRSNSRGESGVYRVIVDNYGKIVIFNKTGDVSWSYTPCLEEVYTAHGSDTCKSISKSYKIDLQTLKSQNLMIDCQKPLEGKVFCVPDGNTLKISNNIKLNTFYKTTETDTSFLCWSECRKNRECVVSSFGRENSRCLLSKDKYDYTREPGWVTYSSKELQIDALNCKPHRKYTVSKGDTCVSLVKKFNISMYEFYRIYPELDCGRLEKGQVVCLPNTKSIPDNNIRLYEHMEEIRFKNGNECWYECLKNSKCVASSTHGSTCFLFDKNYRFGHKEYGWYTRSLTELCNSKSRTNCKI